MSSKSSESQGFLDRLTSLLDTPIEWPVFDSEGQYKGFSTSDNSYPKHTTLRALFPNETIAELRMELATNGYELQLLDTRDQALKELEEDYRNIKGEDLDLRLLKRYFNGACPTVTFGDIIHLVTDCADDKLSPKSESTFNILENMDLRLEDMRKAIEPVLQDPALTDKHKKLLETIIKAEDAFGRLLMYRLDIAESVVALTDLELKLKGSPQNHTTRLNPNQRIIASVKNHMASLEIGIDFLDKLVSRDDGVTSHTDAWGKPSDQKRLIASVCTSLNALVGKMDWLIDPPNGPRGPGDGAFCLS